MQTSTEIAHAEDYRKHGEIVEPPTIEQQCICCKEFGTDVRDCKSHYGASTPLCRDCQPFDHPCDCGKGECLPGTQECLACAIAEDMRPLVRARFARALFHVGNGTLRDKLLQAEIAGTM